MTRPRRAGDGGSGAATLADALAELAGQGYGRQFKVAGDRLRAVDDGRTFSASELRIREYRRFEGASDPDDMAIVYAIETDNGTRGTLVDAFGAYADPAVSAFLDRVAVSRRRPTVR